MDTWNYLQCTTTGDASDPTRVDLFALNSYSWCGDSSYTTSGYDVLVADFSDTSVPVFFSEYGCIKPYPRVFTEVPVLYGPLMTPVLSGGLVYEFSQEDSGYGLVVINSNGSVNLLGDYGTLQSQLNTLNTTLLEGLAAQNTTVIPPNCTSSLITTSGFSTNFTIPDVPPGAQDLIDNGISNAPTGKIVSITTTTVSQAVYAASGAQMTGLAITPLADDQSNTPSGQNASESATSSSSAKPTKKSAAGRVEMRFDGLAASFLLVLGMVVL